MTIGLVLMTCIAIVFVVVSLRLHYQLLNERDNASGYQSGYEASQDTLIDTVNKLEAAQHTAELRKKKCDALQSQINTLEFRWGEIDRENNQLKKRNVALTKETHDTRETLIDSAIKATELLDKLAVADSDLQDAKTEIERLQRELANENDATYQLSRIIKEQDEKIKQFKAEAREQQELINEAARDRLFDCDPRQ